jgi:hypothetical protein
VNSTTKNPARTSVTVAAVLRAPAASAPWFLVTACWIFAMWSLSCACDLTVGCTAPSWHTTAAGLPVISVA